MTLESDLKRYITFQSGKERKAHWTHTSKTEGRWVNGPFMEDRFLVMLRLTLEGGEHPHYTQTEILDRTTSPSPFIHFCSGEDKCREGCVKTSEIQKCPWRLTKRYPDEENIHIHFNLSSSPVMLSNYRNTHSYSTCIGFVYTTVRPISQDTRKYYHIILYGYTEECVSITLESK